MKFKFKIQQYQTDAVESTVGVFNGQPSREAFQYRRDLGKMQKGQYALDADYAGYRNADIELSDQQLIENVRLQQVYKPKILKIMDDWEFRDGWWHDTEEDWKDAARFVTEWYANFV